MLACEILSRDISSYFHVIFFVHFFLFTLLLFVPCSFLIQWIPRQFSEKSPTLSFDLFPAPIKIKCMAKFKCYKWERTSQYRYIFIRKMLKCLKYICVRSFSSLSDFLACSYPFLPNVLALTHKLFIIICQHKMHTCISYGSNVFSLRMYVCACECVCVNPFLFF